MDSWGGALQCDISARYPGRAWHSRVSSCSCTEQLEPVVMFMAEVYSMLLAMPGWGAACGAAAGGLSTTSAMMQASDVAHDAHSAGRKCFCSWKCHGNSGILDWHEQDLNLIGRNASEVQWLMARPSS